MYLFIGSLKTTGLGSNVDVKSVPLERDDFIKDLMFSMMKMITTCSAVCLGSVETLSPAVCRNRCVLFFGDEVEHFRG